MMVEKKLNSAFLIDPHCTSPCQSGTGHPMISYFGSRTEKGFISALIEGPDSFPVSSDPQLPAIDFGNGV